MQCPHERSSAYRLPGTFMIPDLPNQCETPRLIVIDYGCHSFSHRLSVELHQSGHSVRYYANGSLESPNLKSLTSWHEQHPDLVEIIKIPKPYGKLSLGERLKGEIAWSKKCVETLEAEQHGIAAIVVSCIPLSSMSRIARWAKRNAVPMVYWLQDLQGRAIEQLLTKKFGVPGRLAGRLASRYEQRLLRQSKRVITIAPGHDKYLPESVLDQDRFDLLENWCDPDDVPLASRDTDWSRRHALHNTLNIVYSGTLGLKHDLPVFIALAENCRSYRDVRIVIVSSGAAADLVSEEAKTRGLQNLVVLPFQHFSDVPNVLGSAAVLIAPLDPSAGSFCVPSKILSYHCAGRPTVVSIDETNPVAHLIEKAKSGFVVRPGETHEFVTAVRLLLDNAELRQTLGHSARKHAEANFKLQIIAARFLSILKKASVPLSAKAAHQETLVMAAAVTADVPVSD